MSLALLPPTGKKEKEIREPAPKAGLQASAFPSPSPQARGEISRSSLKPSGAAAWGTSFLFPGKVLDKLRCPSRSLRQGLLAGKLEKFCLGGENIRKEKLQELEGTDQKEVSSVSSPRPNSFFPWVRLQPTGSLHCGELPGPPFCLAYSSRTAVCLFVTLIVKDSLSAHV